MKKQRNHERKRQQKFQRDQKRGAQRKRQEHHEMLGRESDLPERGGAATLPSPGGSSLSAMTYVPFFENSQEALAAYERGEISAYIETYARTFPMVAIHLEGAYDHHTGMIADWAQAVIARFQSLTLIGAHPQDLLIVIEGAMPGPRRRYGAIEFYDQDALYVYFAHVPSFSPQKTVEPR